MEAKLVVLELNEVPDRVIDSYVEANPDSNWARIIQRSARFVAATPDTIQLHPKLSWQTFHRGVPDNEHGFVEYNQTEAPGKPEFPPVWEVLRRSGRSIGVGASIGSYPVPDGDDAKDISFYLTDPFAPTFETIPPRLGAFQRLNNLAVQRSGRNVRKGGFEKSDVARLIANLPRLGITPSTCLHTASHLVEERRNRARVVRRRNIQARMTFDVAFNEVRRTKPDFATIFANNVAAAMHRYWAAKFPDDYDDMRMPAEWRDTYSGEIDAAMDEADYMLGRLEKFARANPDYRVMVIASMGQAAVEHEVIENQLIIKDFDAFMHTLGFDTADYEKLVGMEPEYVVRFSEAAGLERFKSRCEALGIGEQRPHLKPTDDRQTTFLVFQNNVSFDHVSLEGREIPLAEAGLHIEPIQDMSGSTAQHVRGGCCFVFDGRGDLSSIGEPGVEHDLTRVTASIVEAFGVDRADYMRAPVPSIVAAISGDAPAAALGAGGPIGGRSLGGHEAEVA